MLLRLSVLALVLSGLSACSDLAGRVTERLSTEGAAAEGVRSMALLAGAVQVRGPQGYCIDPQASDRRRGFAVLAGCALLTEGEAVMPTLDGLITIQFGEAGSASVAGNEADFAAFLRTEAGRTVLSGDGDPARIDEVATVAGADAVLTRFEDASGPSFDGTTGPQWRGFQDIGDRLVTVSVMSFEREPLSRARGERLLAVAMAELAKANAPFAEPVDAEATEEPT